VEDLRGQVFKTRNFKYTEVSDAQEKLTGYYFEIDGQIYFLNKRLSKVAKVESLSPSKGKKLELKALLRLGK